MACCLSFFALLDKDWRLMKIFMVCEFFNDKYDYQENMLARAYHRLGHEVVVVTSTITSLAKYVADRDPGRGARQTEIYEWGILIRVPFRLNVLNRIRYFEPITPLIEDASPDLLYFHDIIPNLYEGVRYVRANPKCSMIMDYHGDASNSGASFVSRRILHGVVRKRILDQARPFLRKVLPVTPSGANFLQKIYRLPSAEIELFPLGTDQHFARKVLKSNSRQRIRAKLGIPEDAVVIFSGGKFAPHKRTEDLIEAAESLADLPVHVILVGSADSDHESYGAFIASLAERNARVHAVGWQDREGVYGHMAASDIAVFPASQSVLWQQSLGMGLPLIVSEQSKGLRGIQDVSYLNRHGNLIVLQHEASLSEQIATHVRRLATNPAARERMSEGAKRTASELLDYATLASRTLDFVGGESRTVTLG